MSKTIKGCLVCTKSRISSALQHVRGIVVFVTAVHSGHEDRKSDVIHDNSDTGPWGINQGNPFRKHDTNIIPWGVHVHPTPSRKDSMKHINRNLKRSIGSEYQLARRLQA